MPSKPKLPQKQTREPQIRDNFQTPFYAIDILIPFLTEKDRAWDGCAGINGEGQITKRLEQHNIEIYGSDIRGEYNLCNFLIEKPDFIDLVDVIVMNVPFSLKKNFWERCEQYGKKYAILVPADYSAWIIDAIKFGCEKIIPNRRINYIPPNIALTVKRGELFEQHIRIDFPQHKKLKDVGKEEYIWDAFYKKYDWYDKYEYEHISNIPSNLIAKYSQSQFHSMWLTKGFFLGKTETFIDLSLSAIKNIIV